MVNGLSIVSRFTQAFLFHYVSQPTVSPASSADMAPISSGSSTWTSSGIPFSFVSMATGIGPSSSGSQATVASVVTSALLAGLGFSGGVISSFPGSLWTSGAQSRHLTPQPDEHAAASDDVGAPVDTKSSERENSKTGGDNDKAREEEREKEEEDEEEEEEEDKNQKKQKKRPLEAVEEGRMYDGVAGKDPACGKSDATAKEKEETAPVPTYWSPVGEDLRVVYNFGLFVHNRTHVTTFLVPEEYSLMLTLRRLEVREHHATSIHIGEC